MCFAINITNEIKDFLAALKFHVLDCESMLYKVTGVFFINSFDANIIPIIKLFIENYSTRNVAYNKLQKIIPLRMQLTLVSAVQLNMLREN